ncbi:MAG: hypothetical protein ACI4UY_12065 [Kiritimatiellia bacterium]
MLFQNITPFFKHFSAACAARLVLVPEFSDQAIRRATPQREIDDPPLIVRFVAHTLYADRVALRQGLKRKVFLEESFCLILGSIVAVGEYVEEVAIIDIAFPVSHEVPEKSQLLSEKPTIAHVVLESLHRFFSCFCLTPISNIRANARKTPKPCGFGVLHRSYSDQTVKI